MTLPRGRARAPADVDTLAAAIAGQGASLTALYDVRRGLTVNGGVVDAWAESRGRTLPLVGAGAARPASDASGLTFDGVDDFLRAAGAYGITTDFGVFMVLKGQTAIAGRAMELSIGAVTSITSGQQTAGPQWSVKALANASMLANAASPQILHSRKKSGVQVGSQVGAAAEVTAVDATGAQTPDRLTIGANRIDIAASFAPIVGLRAIGLIAGDYVAAIATLVNNWAVANHGAVA